MSYKEQMACSLIKAGTNSPTPCIIQRSHSVLGRLVLSSVKANVPAISCVNSVVWKDGEKRCRGVGVGGQGGGGGGGEW